MRRAGRDWFRVPAALAVALWLCAPAPAQSPAPLSREGEAAPPVVQAASPAPVAPAKDTVAAKSPVDTFRELLAMTPAERKRVLADRPPELQRQILAKVREYEALRPNQQQVRLAVTELYFYLWPLLKTPATNRPVQLALVPERQRKPIEDRLREWDNLPTARQQEMLTNAAAIRYFSEIQRAPPMPDISPSRQARLEEGIRRWRALSEERRQKTMLLFNRFFDLTDREKQKALDTLSEPERRQIEKTLARFTRLSPEERADCVSSFAKFADLSLAERQQFLKNADRWKLLTPDERKDWREVVSALAQSPPLPPGVAPPMPPEDD